MKFLLPLFLMPFLCVKCCPWDDCEGADIFCDELLPLPPELENAIPYEDGEMLNFRYSDEPRIIEVKAIRSFVEGEIGRNCQDRLFAALEDEEPGPSFRCRISTGGFGDRSILSFNFSFAVVVLQDQEQFGIIYDEAELLSVDPPNSLRLISDTTMAGINYQDVARVMAEEPVDVGKISAFYYNRTDGLLRVERVDRPAFFRVE